MTAHEALLRWYPRCSATQTRCSVAKLSWIASVLSTKRDRWLLASLVLRKRGLSSEPDQGRSRSSLRGLTLSPSSLRSWGGW